MGSSSSDRINISARTQKLEVDNRFPLRFYFRMADIILRQADVYREEKNTLYLYITLIRFASLVSETMPDHQDYITCHQRERSSWKKVKKKLLNSLVELEELKPEVKQKINELNRRNGYKNSRHVLETGESLPCISGEKKVESVGTCSSSTGGENTPKFPFGHCGNKRSKTEMRIQILLGEAHDWKLPTPCRPMPQAPPAIIQATAPPVEEDIELVKAIDASSQSALLERIPFSDPLQIHETNALNSSSTSMECRDFLQHETTRAGDSGSHSKIHVISTIQTSTTSDSISSYFTPSAPPVPDDPFEDCLDDHFEDCLDDPFQDCRDDPFQCRSIESAPIQKCESFSSCVICMDAAVEGAFIPCGHMAGCMACMNDIIDKNWDCPVCRAKVDQVLKLYVV